jgi:hypothetical protein
MVLGTLHQRGFDPGPEFAGYDDAALARRLSCGIATNSLRLNQLRNPRPLNPVEGKLGVANTWQWQARKCSCQTIGLFSFQGAKVEIQL